MTNKFPYKIQLDVQLTFIKAETSDQAQVISVLNVTNDKSCVFVACKDFTHNSAHTLKHTNVDSKKDLQTWLSYIGFGGIHTTTQTFFLMNFKEMYYFRVRMFATRTKANPV